MIDTDAIRKNWAGAEHGCVPTILTLCDEVERLHRHMSKAMFCLHYRRPKTKRARGLFWSYVGSMFSTGSTTSSALCREFGYDPETGNKVEDSQ